MLAVISGIVASLLIPAVTRSWQDRPRELALKRDLVEQVSKSAADAVSTGNSFGFEFERAKPSRGKRDAFLSAALRRWRVDSSVIESELSTYFGDTSLPRQWQLYVNAVELFLRYTSHAEEYPTSFFGFHLRNYFRGVRFDNTEQELERRSFAAEPSSSGPLRNEVTPLLEYERDQIANRIVASDAAGFSHGFWIFK
jgi:hypothetical protein